MSFDGSNIKNVGSNSYVDLWGGSKFASGSPIALYTPLNKSPSGTPNQQWRIIPVLAGRNLFTIQSVLTGQYVSLDSNNLSQPKASLVTVSMPWEIKNSGNADYTIKVPYTDLFWSVGQRGCSRHTAQITLATGNGSDGQKWITFTTLPSHGRE
ncbi:hypothetical protein F5887DRAFT_919376 [Amanita rubescens]|nr:hypothetical protein F5887DRAFT_919376 [Amanita rubescens]